MEAIWPGSSSFSAGETPYGFYDSDTEFSGSGVHSVDRFADWAAKRLGYPIVAVEMQDVQFYACYEEAITEYSAQVNQANLVDNILFLQGQETGSGATKTDLTHRKVTPTLGTYIRLAEQYGSEAGVGGTIDYKSGSIEMKDGQQDYDLTALWANVSESGNSIEVRKVFYEEYNHLKSAVNISKRLCVSKSFNSDYRFSDSFCKDSEREIKKGSEGPSQ